MRWILLVFLLISCVDNTEEDMKMFISSMGQNPQQLPENGVRVFIYTGQSNCPGRGLNTDASPEELSVQPKFKIWSKSNNQFESLQVGVNNLNSVANSHGIELGLAQNCKTYYPDETIYLCKWGVSSTMIVEHLEGGSVFDELWPEFVVKGINSLISAGKIPYVYWIYTQGERDSNLGAGGQPELYAGSFDTLISLWQTRIGVNLPMANYQLLDPLPPTYDQTGIVNNDFAEKSLTEVRYQVQETKHLSNIGDDLHYDYTSQKEISVLMLDYFQNFLGQPVTEFLIP